MIKVENVTYRYGYVEDEEYNDRPVLNNLSLHIPKGKHTCILGHNGSGKSTLAKLLIGLDFPQSGKIIVDGIEVKEGNLAEIRSKIGIVFQNPDNQFIGSTVQDDIAFGLENLCIPTQDMPHIIEKYAKMVGMEQYLNYEPTRLSGGQKQRVAIAGVLAMNPDIMIFDEATSMLDPLGVSEVNKSLDNLGSTDKTLVSITHDIEYACKADNIIVLKFGELMYSGTPEEVFLHADELKATGLDIPYALKISETLKKEGLEIKPVLTLKELKDSLWQLK